MNFLFDLLAPLYERLVGDRDPQPIQDLLKLPCEGWLLDAGGGTGRVSAPLRTMAGKLVLGDFSFPMLRQAQGKQGLLPVNLSALRLPYPDETFDRILVVDALHHFPDQPGAIAELVRALKPGGRLLIEEPDINRFGVKLIALAEKLLLMNSHFHTAREIRNMVAAHGLKARIASDGRNTAWVVADK